MGQKINNQYMNYLGRKNFSIYIRYFIGFSVIVALIYHIQSKENILTVLNQFDINLIIPAFIIICIHLSCLFIMWRIIVLSVGKIDPGYKMLLHSFFGGRTLGFITPGQTGDLLKGMFFTSGIRLKGTSLSMIFSGYSMLVRIILGSIACIYFILTIPDFLIVEFNYVVFIILFMIIITFISLFFYQDKIKKQFIKYLPQWVMNILRLFKAQLKSKSSAQFILLFIIALTANLLAAIAFMIVLLGFNIDALTFRGLMAFEAAYFATSLVPITPAGIGVRESSRVYFFALIGYNQAAVLCASFIMYALNIMLPAVIGIGSMKYFWKTEPDHS